MSERTSIVVPISVRGVRIKADELHGGKLKLSTSREQPEESALAAARIVLKSATSRSETEYQELLVDLFPAGTEEIVTHQAALLIRPDVLPQDCTLWVEVPQGLPVRAFTQSMDIELGQLSGNAEFELTCETVKAQELKHGPTINIQARTKFDAKLVGGDLEVSAPHVTIADISEGSEVEIEADKVEVTSNRGALSLTLGLRDKEPSAHIKNMRGRNSSLFVDVGVGKAVLENAESGTVTAVGEALGHVVVGVAPDSSSRELDRVTVADRPTDDHDVLIVRDQGSKVQITVEQALTAITERPPQVITGHVLPSAPAQGGSTRRAKR